MTPQSELEIHGNFLANPFAELLAEIAQARLDGSLRLSVKEKKCVLYFKGGRVVFAVSNARESRLFDILLRRNRLTREDLGQFPNFANDLEFATQLREKNILSKQECDQLFTEQIEAIIADILTWPEGEWQFSSLARIRDGLAFQTDTGRLLVEYGRCMPVDTMLGRFRSLDESFRRSQLAERTVALMPDEAFVLSRAENAPLTASDLVSIAAMSEETALHTIYVLWLGGLLVRNDWQPAFSRAAISAMKNARLEIKREAQLPGVPTGAPEKKISETKTAPPSEIELGPQSKAPETTISIEEYLERTEKAKTYYDILGIDAKAETGELKRAYFGLARLFHPDLFHAEGGETLRRIQNAFTELAQAHETLKNAETREAYDYRMRNELADGSSGDSEGGSTQFEQAAEQFKSGYDLLLDEEPEHALPFLARAVHFDPKNARYHAYYGKALSADAKQRHKAESELQSALKIDPNNPTFRLLLAEFFIKFNLLKRAEGELTRLLALSPNNREARDLLESLRK